MSPTFVAGSFVAFHRYVPFQGLESAIEFFGLMAVLIALCYAGSLAARPWRFARATFRRACLARRGWLPATGRIVEHTAFDRNWRPNHGWNAVVEFATADGRVVRHVFDKKQLRSPPVTNKKVNLLYDPANPQDATLGKGKF